MKIAVIKKNTTANAELKDWLLDGLRSLGGFDIEELSSPKDISADFDRVLVFGGDGTMLETVRYTAPLGIAVLGVNLGHLGFLTEFDKDVTAKELASALNSNEFSQKSLLEIGFGKKTYLALNELVVKSSTTRPILIDLYVGGKFADTFKSDGLIVSTPTGSTAYSLSAGGPIVSPEVKAIVVNPICPHSLHSRPIVVRDDAEIDIRIAGEEGEASVVVDGSLVGAANPGEIITLKTSSKSAKFVVGKDENFFDKLLKKMNVWSTTLQKTE